MLKKQNPRRFRHSAVKTASEIIEHIKRFEIFSKRKKKCVTL